MSDLAGCFSHNTDHWRTPTEIYNFFMSEGYIDPCPFHADFNGLERFYKNQKIYINPPYSQIKLWVDYALKLLGGGVKLLCSYLRGLRLNIFISSWNKTLKFYFLKGGFILMKAKTQRLFLLA